MKLNKKGNKVKLDKKYKVLNLLGYGVEWGIPLAYLGWQFDLFTFNRAPFAVTGWGFVAIFIVFQALKQRITDFIKDYDKNLGLTAKRAKKGFLFTTIVGVLLISQIFISGFLWLFGVLAVSNFVSLIPYHFYDEQFAMKKRIEEKIKDENVELDLETLKKLKEPI